MSDTKRAAPWAVRLDKEREARAARAAKTLGLVEDGEVAKGRLLRLGLDLACKHAIRRQLDGAGGLINATRAGMRGIRQLLLDAVAVTAGAELALLDLLGLTATEWGEVLAQYPDVAKAYAVEVAKRDKVIA
jgi:hypothetical protein